MEGDDVRLTITSENVKVPFKLGSDVGLIVNELVTNAIKHGGRDSCEISFELKRNGEGLICIMVRDKGKGFPAETLDAKETKTSRMHGLGIISALARRCGGSLLRRNEEGAVVTLTLDVDNS